MTNGEKIQTILDVDRDCTEVHGENGTMTFTVTQDFWDSEYKEPQTSKWCDTCKEYDQVEREVLDKIKSEILGISSYEGFELGGVKDGYRIAMVNVLDIIDKYKAESETQEVRKKNEI